jgi:hypothetical protein
VDDYEDYSNDEDYEEPSDEIAYGGIRSEEDDYYKLDLEERDCFIANHKCDYCLEFKQSTKFRKSKDGFAMYYLCDECTPIFLKSDDI